MMQRHFFLCVIFLGAKLIYASDQELVLMKEFADLQDRVVSMQEQLDHMCKQLGCSDFIHDRMPHRSQPIFDYIKEKNLTLANAHSQLQKKFDENYAQKYSLSNSNADFRSVLLKLIETIPDIRTNIVKHLGLRTTEAQNSFLHKPLYEALMWYSNCVRGRTFFAIDLDTRLLLTCDQHNCLASILHASTKKPKSERYVDEETHEPIAATCVFITPKAKNTLLSLPQEFVTNKKAAAMLKDMIIAEKSSKMSNLINTPLSVLFHVMRDDLKAINPRYSRVSLILALSFATLGSIEAMRFLRYVNIANTNPIYSPLLTLGLNIQIPAIIKATLDHTQGIDTSSEKYNTCIIKRPAQLVNIINIGALTAIAASIFLQYNYYGIPLSYIFSGLGLAITPFIVYDQRTHGLKCAVKTQSIAQLIETSKKQRPQQFCTLL